MHRQWLACLITLSLWVGCQRADDPALRTLRDQYLLPQAPSGAVGVLQARAQLAPPSPGAADAAATTSTANPAAPDSPEHGAETAGAAPGTLSTATLPVVLTGRIGAADQQPAFERGKACFLVTDTSQDELAGAHEHEHEHEHGHDEQGHEHEHHGAEHADNCPFCKAARESAGDATAFVQLVDAHGQVLPVDAQKLLSVQPGQLVVVQGTGAIDEQGSFVVTATGIYVPR